MHRSQSMQEMDLPGLKTRGWMPIEVQNRDTKRTDGFLIFV